MNTHPWVKTLLRGLLIGAVVATVWASARPAWTNDGNGINAFGRQAAGTYLGTLTCNSTGSRVFPTLITLGADGTYVSEDTSDAGDNLPEQLASDLRGNWVQTGRYELALSAVDLEFTRAGVHAGYLTWHATGWLNRDFDEITYRGRAPVFLADQDPLDPNAVPILVLQCGGAARRIPVVR
jgi:hypothetical protein